MAKRLTVVNKLRPKIVSQGVVDVGELAKRVAKNTTFNVEEIDAILRLAVGEASAALQAGETVELDDLLSVSPNMKVGGAVNMALRANRGATAGLNNSLLWTAAKVKNHVSNLREGKLSNYGSTSHGVSFNVTRRVVLTSTACYPA